MAELRANRANKDSISCRDRGTPWCSQAATMPSSITALSMFLSYSTKALLKLSPFAAKPLFKRCRQARRGNSSRCSCAGMWSRAMS